MTLSRPKRVTCTHDRPSIYHLVSRLHLPSDDVDAEDVDAFRSAPGAALPENGLVRLFISEKEKKHEAIFFPSFFFS